MTVEYITKTFCHVYLTEMTMPARITKPVEQSLFMIAAMIVISVQGVIRSERLSLIEVSKKFVIWPTVKYVNSAKVLRVM